MDLIELAVVAAPIFMGVPVLIAFGLSVYGRISVSRWTWAGFVGFCLLACTPLASLVGYLVAQPFPWRPVYSGLVVSPIAFVLMIIVVKRGVRITGKRTALVRWIARAGASVLGLFLLVVWLFNLLGYLAKSGHGFLP